MSPRPAAPKLGAGKPLTLLFQGGGGGTIVPLRPEEGAQSLLPGSHQLLTIGATPGCSLQRLTDAEMGPGSLMASASSVSVQ